MKYFVLVFFCNLLSSGRLQELYNGNSNNLIPGNAWRSNNGQVKNNVEPKPCAREGNSENNQPEQTLESLDTPKFLPPVHYERQQPPPPPQEITTQKIQDHTTSASRRQEPESESRFQYVPDNLLERGPENDYLIEPSNMIDAEAKSEYNSAPLYVLDRDLDEYKNLPKSNSRSEQNKDSPNRLSDNEEDINPNRRTQSDSQSKCSMENSSNSRRSMTANDNGLQGDFEMKNTAPYTEPYAQDHLRLFTSGNKKLSKDDISRPYDKIPTTSIDRTDSRVNRNDARREMLEPTAGSTNMEKSPLTLMQSERICYACSTANNPTCWAPDRRTTVKYCRKGNNACITKTFGSGSTFTLIRDCGRSCDDPEMGGLGPRYKSCSMCHSELCNGGFSINGQSIIFALFLTAVVKYMN